MKKDEFEVLEVKLVEQIKFSLPVDKQNAVADHMRGCGWYFTRVSPGSTKRIVILTATRDDTMHATDDLRDEVADDLGRA